jgi:tRNA (guanine37-N1)-methyltransferase
MKIHFVTLFPESFGSYFSESIIGRAVREGNFTPVLHNLADFSIRPTRRVDRRPYGGFPGMVIEPEPLARVLEKIDSEAGAVLPKIFFSPRGERFRQETAESLAAGPSEIIFICGHYEGVDERVIEHFGIRQISVGDFVLSSGELAAMVVADAVVRLLPGVIAEESLAEESFSESL